MVNCERVHKTMQLFSKFPKYSVSNNHADTYKGFCNFNVNEVYAKALAVHHKKS